MRVIIGRALPDVRDGLKPVHRRILYAMHELGLRPTSRYRKCASIVGDVMGKYHPHGDAAVYDTLVRMAQDFTMRYPLVDGQGNFGSVDGDPPAAMRYTEARLAKIAEEHAGGHRQGDGGLPSQLRRQPRRSRPSCPTSLPNLLVNGSTGIAVGMATNIPPHNLGEVVDGLVYLIENQDLAVERRWSCSSVVPGPDFPTGGYILGKSGIRQAYRTGRGTVTMRARAEIEQLQGRQGSDRRHRDPVPGQQGQADREDRRAGAREEDRRHLRPPRRDRPRRACGS